MKETDPDTPQTSGRPQGDRPHSPPKVVPTSPDVPSGLDPGPKPPYPGDPNFEEDLQARHRREMAMERNRASASEPPTTGSSSNEANQKKDSGEKH